MSVIVGEILDRTTEADAVFQSVDQYIKSWGASADQEQGRFLNDAKRRCILVGRRPGGGS